MRKKRNDFDAVGAERMTDAELSKKLGSYQRTEDISICWWQNPPKRRKKP